jgi:hypothetical protein
MQYRQDSRISKFHQNTPKINYKIIPDYIKKVFRNRLDNLINKNHKKEMILSYKQHNKLTTSAALRNINQDWFFLKQTLIKIKESDTLKDYKKKNLNSQQNQYLNFPLHIRQMANTISKLHNIFLQFNKKRILRYHQNNTLRQQLLPLMISKT